MIARAKLEVILGVLVLRFAGGPMEPVEPTKDPAPLTAISAEGIAVVSVIGTLVSRSGYLDATSGLLSYGDIGDAIASAVSMRGLILDVDSPEKLASAESSRFQAFGWQLGRDRSSSGPPPQQ